MLVAVGLGVVVADSVLLFTVLKYVGAAYLVYLGVRAIQHRRAFDDAAPIDGPVLTRRTAVRQGFVVGVSNPKAFMIFGALLPQFVDRAAGHVQLQMLVLGLLAATIGVTTDSIWAIAAARRARLVHADRRVGGKTFGAVGGASMIGLGVVLASGERPRTLRSGLVHVAVELVALELQLVDPVLDHVADADDADQLPVGDHGHVPDPALGHDLHQVVEQGVLVAGLARRRS